MTIPISRKSNQANRTTIVTLRDRASEMLRVADHLEATEKFLGANRAGNLVRSIGRSPSHKKQKTAGGAARKGPTVVAKAA